jgi:predicted XRE-type DNA-binding protein
MREFPIRNHRDARAYLAVHLREKIRSWKVTQKAAAARLGMKQQRLSDLLNPKRLDLFSVQGLLQLALTAELRVMIFVGNDVGILEELYRKQMKRAARKTYPGQLTLGLDELLPDVSPTES